VHKANVYVDLSGWSPKYFPPQLVQEINSRLQDKALFGTDYPFIKPDRWLRDFEKLDIKPEVKPKIMIENAKKVLGLK
jgi:predicted TIM-barrel fold metal-dependent hydrolase